MSEDMTHIAACEVKRRARTCDSGHPRRGSIPDSAPGHTYASVTDQISAIVLTRRTPRGWYIGFGVAFAPRHGAAVCHCLSAAAGGVGMWGVNCPVAWGFAIINFVWWIGIGHAGTLISAILLLLRQEWRTSINRFAEAMTLFAVACAGLFPLLHLGRPWLVYWLLPYPNTMGLWPQFRSPLVWDVFRRVDLCHGVAAVLVCRAHPRPGDPARPRPAPPGTRRSTAFWPWGGVARRCTGSATRWPTCSWPGWPRRWSSRCTP